MSEPQAISPSETDAASLRGKLEAFAAALSAGELAILRALVERATPAEGEDTSGYFWWFFQPAYQPQYQPHAGLISDKGNGLISHNRGW